MYPTQRVASPQSQLFNYFLFAHGRLFYRYHGSEQCRFSPQAAYRLLSHLAADNGKPTTLWDPFCGTGFILSVAGYFFPHAFPSLLGSDVKPEAAECSARNLALFTERMAFERRRAEIDLLMRPSPRHRQRWSAVLAYLDQLGASWDFNRPAYSSQTFVADAADARRDETGLTIFGDLPYGRASQLVGAVDYMSCLQPLLQAHPRARALFIAPMAVSEDFCRLSEVTARSLRIRKFKGGRIGASFAPVGCELPVLSGAGNSALGSAMCHP